MTDPATPAAAAPGWYPDSSGAQRWWDGRGWTEHVSAPVATADPYARPALPEGTRTDTVWIWIVALATFLSLIPMFFLDFGGYIRASMSLETGTYRGLPPELANFFGIYALTLLLAFVTYGLTILAAFRDYRHLIGLGAVRPFHWAFAFIPYALVYLIGRHVVLRKMVRTSGAPLWVHIALWVVYVVGFSIWMIVVMQQMFLEIVTLDPQYGSYS
jgi:hypothetical protein